MNGNIAVYQKLRPVILRETLCSWRFAITCLTVFLLFSATGAAQDAPRAAKKPVLIRDTDIAEEKEPEPEPVREPDPIQSKKSLGIGNTYLKKRNYAAAISRYIEAISWQQDSIPAHEALARAYEKNGEFTKAIQTLETVIEKNPDSPKNKEFQGKITGLREKLQ